MKFNPEKFQQVVENAYLDAYRITTDACVFDTFIHDYVNVQSVGSDVQAAIRELAKRHTTYMLNHNYGPLIAELAGVDADTYQPRNYEGGICGNVLVGPLSHASLVVAYYTWENFSGDTHFPVPDLALFNMDAETKFGISSTNRKADMWDIDTVYGATRRDLLAHIVRFCQSACDSTEE